MDAQVELAGSFAPSGPLKTSLWSGLSDCVVGCASCSAPALPAQDAAAAIQWLAQQPSVAYVQPVPALSRQNHYASALMQSGNRSVSKAAAADFSNTRLRPYWALGLDGSGERPACHARHAHFKPSSGPCASRHACMPSCCRHPSFNTPLPVVLPDVT